MATLDDSPSQFVGLSWSTWAEVVEKNNPNENEEEEPPDIPKESSDSMKLKKQDMSLYGLCPAQDEFCLVVCEKCGQVIKPQALQKHIETRHGGASPSKSRSRTSTSPREKGKKGKKNHTNPVVKVERMPSDVVRQKLNKRTPGYETERPRPPEKAELVVGKGKVEEVTELITLKPEELVAAMASSSFMHQGGASTSSQGMLGTTAKSAEQKDEVALAVEALSAMEVEQQEPPKPMDMINVKVENSFHQDLVFEQQKDLHYDQPPGSSQIRVSDSFSIPSQGSTITLDPLKEAALFAGIKKEDVEKVPTPPPTLPTPPPTIDRHASPGAPPGPASFPLSSFPTPTTTPPDSQEAQQAPKIKLEVFDQSSSDGYNILNQPDSTSSSIMPVLTKASHGNNSVSMVTVTTMTTIAASPVTTATVVVTATATSSSPAPITTPTPVITQTKSGKDPRFLPCKDRVYDAERHCGVWMADSNRHCTRSLTCKTHALSLRRSVKGRSKSFDQLLLDHRAAKEAALKAKQEAAAAAQAAKAGAHPNVCLTALSPAAAAASAASNTHVTGPATVRSLTTMHGVNLAAAGANKLARQASHAAAVAAAAASSSSKLPSSTQQLHKPSTLPVFPVRHEAPVPLPDTSTSRLSSDGEDDDDSKDPPDYNCISHPPRPAAVNGFGAWLHHGSGCYKFNRKEDLLRSAFAAAVEKHLHPPPHKKLCVESKLKGSNNNSNNPHNTVTLSANQLSSRNNSGDPYDFTTPADGTLPPTTSTQQPNPAAVQAANTALALANKAAAKSLAKSNKNSPASAGGFTRSIKLTKDISGSNRANLTSTKIGSLGSVTGATTLAASKRKRSGSSPSAGSVGLGTVNVSVNAAVTSSSANPISIAIPAVNLSGNTFNATLGTSKVAPIGSATSGAGATKITANHSMLKDLNFVVSGVDSSNLVNGQIVSIPGVNLADMTTIQLNNLTPINITDASNATGSKSAKKQGGKGASQTANRINSTIMTLPGNATVVNASGALLPGTVTMVTGGGAQQLVSSSAGSVAASATSNTSLHNSQGAIFTNSTTMSASPAQQLPNGQVQVGQIKGFPISINHISGLHHQQASAGNTSANNNGSQENVATLLQANAHKTPSKSISLTNMPRGSSANGTPQKVPLISCSTGPGGRGATIQTQIPLSAQQLAAAALNLTSQQQGQARGNNGNNNGGQQIQLTSASGVTGATTLQAPVFSTQMLGATPLHLHPSHHPHKPGKAGAAAGKMMQGPVSLTIVTPSPMGGGGGAGGHHHHQGVGGGGPGQGQPRTLLLQPAAATPPEDHHKVGAAPGRQHDSPAAAAAAAAGGGGPTQLL